MSAEKPLPQPLPETERGAGTEPGRPFIPVSGRGRGGLGYFTLAALALVAAVGLGYAVLRDPGPGDDLGRWQGDWQVRANDRDAPVTVRVEGDRWSYVVTARPGLTYRLALNPAATPKEIDLTQIGAGDKVATNTHGPGRGSEVKLHGVYAFDGDTARVALAPGVEPRPTSLDAVDGPPTLTLTRVNK